MKNILLPIFILLSLASFGQAPIALDTVNNACHIDKIGFAKDNMTYTLNGDSSINIFIVGAASYQNTHYSRFRDPGGNPFANRTALTNWLDLYFFANALADSSSTGGGDTATLESVTTGTGNNVTPNALQVTGFSNINLTLPSTAVFDQGAISGLYRLGATGVMGAVEITDSNVSLGAATASLTVRPQNGTDASVLITGRMQGQAGINATDYAVMSQLLSLGETSTTAYRGDRGKTAYDHSQIVDGTNPHATSFANIASKPTTLAGYGITNAVTQGGDTRGVPLTIGTKDAFIIEFMVNNSVVGRMSSTGLISGAGVANLSSGNNALVSTATTGTTISSNKANSDNVLTINNINASSSGLNLVSQNAGSTTASISKTGVITSTQFNVSALNAAPATATSTGTTGEIRITSGFIYVCIATNTWVRATMETW